MTGSRLRSLYSGLYEDISAILFDHDPVGLNFGHNTDEHNPEVDTILPRLENAYGVDDVQQIVYEEFQRWFGAYGDREPSGGTSQRVGREEQYQAIAEEIWEAMSRYGLRQYDDYHAP